MKRLTIALSALALAAIAAVDAQQFRTGVEVVRVDALVMSGRQPVAGLSADDFELKDSGVPQTITSVSYERLPLNVICVLDVSGSVAGQPLRRLMEGTSALIDALGVEDRAALIAFSNRLRLHSALTSEKALLKAALANLDAQGPTSLLDATFAGLALRETDLGRTLLLLFSDGVDTASWLSARKVLDAARRTDVVIYPVSVRGDAATPGLATNGSGRVVSRPRSDVGAESLLKALADETGGRRFIFEQQTDLRQAFLSVLQEFRQRYVLTYTPAGVPAAGWHPIEVRVRSRTAQVTARRGYASVH